MEVWPAFGMLAGDKDTYVGRPVNSCSNGHYIGAELYLDTSFFGKIWKKEKKQRKYRRNCARAHAFWKFLHHPSVTTGEITILGRIMCDCAIRAMLFFLVLLVEVRSRIRPNTNVDVEWAISPSHRPCNRIFAYYFELGGITIVTKYFHRYKSQQIKGNIVVVKEEERKRTLDMRSIPNPIYQNE